MTILIATSETDFDPTEVAVPWRILRNGGHSICFATQSGKAGIADHRMLDGNNLGLLRSVLVAQKPAQALYQDMLQDPDFQNPISYDDINIADFDGLILPGGHAKGIKPFLESPILQRHIAAFFDANLPVGAICHGVVAASRTVNPSTGKSVLFGRKTTALLKKQERLAYQLTRRKLGDYYLTYPVTVEDEVTAALQSVDDFVQGPTPILRDSLTQLNRGFTLRDGNYLSARWPGDAHRFATDFLKIL